MNEKSYKKIDALGIGITSLCNLNCPHCYSRKLIQKSISLQELESIIKNFPNIKKVNFGTGESVLNKDFTKIVDFLSEKNIEIALTTNGFSLETLSENYLKKFKDIDVSLDFPNSALHNEWRGKHDAFDMAIRAIEKCKEIGLTVSIAMCLMSNNYKHLPEFRLLLDKYDIPLRINLYKPVDTDKYLMNYSEFWESIKLLSENFELVSNSEPLLTLVAPEKLKGSPCGNSARLHPDGKITPCVYLSGEFSDFEKFKKMKLQILEKCSNCSVANYCRGGCLGRRLLTFGSPEPDQYCPIINKKEIPEIKFIRAKSKDFIHSSYLCTIIVK